MRIFALFLFGNLAFFVGPLPPATAQDMNAIQRLYQQNLVGNILPPPLISAPPTQRHAVAAPAPRTAGGPRTARARTLFIFFNATSLLTIKPWFYLAVCCVYEWR